MLLVLSVSADHGRSENGERQIVLQREITQNDHRSRTTEALRHIVAAAHHHYPIDQRSGQTGGGIDILAEYQRLLVDKNVAQHASECACDYTHNSAYPHGIARVETFLDTDHAEKCQTDAVKEKQQFFAADEKVAKAFFVKTLGLQLHLALQFVHLLEQQFLVLLI